MSLPAVPYHSHISFLFPTWYTFIVSYSSIQSFKYLTASLHLPLSSPYKVYSISNNSCFPVSTSPHLHLSSSYFHGIIYSLSLTDIIPLPSVLLLHPHFNLQNFYFLDILSFVQLFLPCCIINIMFHLCLPTSHILLQMCFFQG